ncbi:D-2-hydroxyacid dehydrogenase [Motilimonas cestriensis]|uniref:D-2-hydroxyacid dehydrogenase n=1 Tax=Motilimonas cestriensis TaxID=2742685 RepID=A0ABS8W6P1_9GAMM|nr:D-2-hydroxyacid dehydrogenase [Motilimonas cestriensis]MCE2594669.1 D-2-hydroxyacid dehydrogenase [Motilimonas cestriensis]
MTNTLLILSKDAKVYQQLLSGRLPPDIHVLATDNIESVMEMQQQITLALAEPALIAPALTKLPHLKWLQSTFAGVDALQDDSLPRDYLLTGVKDIFGPLISEYVMGHWIALLRQFNLYHTQQRQQIWQAHPYTSLQNKTMVITGTGSIGRHLAKTASCFGVKVLGVNTLAKQWSEFDQCYTLEQLDTVLAQGDIVVNALPATTKTQQLFNLDRFKQMPSHAIFINIGRGSAVNEVDLNQALEQNLIAHAACDVFTIEPLPVESPLWQNPHMTITPHHAAVSFPNQIAEIFLGNLSLFLSSKPLKYSVDLVKGY